MSGQFFCAKATGETSQIVVVGVPFDGTSSFRPGSRFAPDHIRLYSEGTESYSPYQDRDLAEVDFYDAGNADVRVSNFPALRATVRAQVEALLRAGKKVIALGGEHLITLPVVEAYVETYPELRVIHFDAHCDLLPDYEGEKYSHAAVIRRISELIDSRRIYQFGIRSGLKFEFEFGRQQTNFYPFALNPQVIERMVAELADAPVYVTIDMDVLDPSIFPGTGTPEPGGATFKELLQALLLLKPLNLVGADLVELCPAYDHSDVSTMTAITLLRELLILLGS